MCSFEKLRSRSDLIFEFDVLADFLEVKWDVAELVSVLGM